MNRMKTLILLAVLTALFLWVGQLLGGRQGMMIALIFALGMNFVSYWFSDKIVLKMYGAQPVTETEAPEFFAIVRDLAQRAQIPMPKVYVIPEEAPNAFATGRDPDHAAVAATQGLLRLMSREEVTGVIAHELGHVKNRDTLIMTVAATLAGALSQLANFALFFGGGRRDDGEGGHPLAGLIGILVAPFAAMLIQMAISRSREFLADEASAQITGNPMALANALRKLEGWKAEVPMHARLARHGAPFHRESLHRGRHCQSLLDAPVDEGSGGVARRPATEMAGTGGGPLRANVIRPSDVVLFPFAETWWVYGLFLLGVLAVLALDLGVFHRKAHAVSFREAVGVERRLGRPVPPRRRRALEVRRVALPAGSAPHRPCPASSPRPRRGRSSSSS